MANEPASHQPRQPYYYGNSHFHGWKQGAIQRPAHRVDNEDCPLFGVPRNAAGEIGIFNKVFWLDWHQCNCQTTEPASVPAQKASLMHNDQRDFRWANKGLEVESHPVIPYQGDNYDNCSSVLLPHEKQLQAAGFEFDQEFGDRSRFHVTVWQRADGHADTGLPQWLVVVTTNLDKTCDIQCGDWVSLLECLAWLAPIALAGCYQQTAIGEPLLKVNQAHPSEIDE